MKNWFSLEKHVCIVAGAQGLLGYSIAGALLDSGAEVYSLDRQQTHPPLPGEMFTEIDLCNEVDLRNFFSKLKKRDDEKYSFINCSYPRTTNWGSLDFKNVTMRDWNANVEMHMGSAFLFSQLAVDKMESSGGGSLVNFASIYGILGPDLSIYDGTSIKNPSPYAAIKSGIIGLTRYIATVYGSKNIRANVLAPGGILNEQPESFVKAYSKKTPAGKMGSPADIAGVAAFLVGPAASYINGQVITVDGGWSAW